MSTRPPSRPRSCRAVPSLLLLAVLALGACSFGRLWEPSREQVLERILPSAVQVVLEQQEGRRFRSSSGIAIGARGSGHETECFVVTAGHTVSGPGAATKAIYVVFDRHRGGGTKVEASVVAHRGEHWSLLVHGDQRAQPRHLPEHHERNGASRRCSICVPR